LFSPSINGILDRRSSKIYDISGLTLLHLGGRRFNLRPNSVIFKQEANIFPIDNKIAVLGNLVPALLLPSLNLLKEYNNEVSKQEKIITDFVFRYNVLVNEKEKEKGEKLKKDKNS
jgi:hypothetical protein